GFLYEPAAAVRYRSDWPAASLIVAAGALVALVAAGLLWRRRSWWSGAAGATAATGERSPPDGELAQTAISGAATPRKISDRMRPSLTRLRQLPAVLPDRVRLPAVLRTLRLRAGAARWRARAVEALNRMKSAM